MDDSTPLCYDHGAIVPVVAVIVPRAQNDGFSVYVSGPDDDCLKHLANEALRK